MSKVQVAYASRHGGTAGIARRIAEVLRTEGIDAVAVDTADRPEVVGFDAHVVGSGVYLGSWLKDGIEFLERNQATLATRPVWLFSSGPLPGSSKDTGAEDPLTQALGPTEGIGSGGRKRITALATAISSRDHRVFQGAYDPEDPPTSIQERVVRLMPGSKRILPTGDFREWDAIESWARQIAQGLAAASPVA